jgi:hypothetical protein
MQESCTGEVNLHNISADVMEVVLEYIYSRTLRATVELAGDLFIAADMLQIPAVTKECLTGNILYAK